MRTSSTGIVVVILLALAATAFADVNVERRGSENPMQEIAKSTIYGALCGVMLGGAVALIHDGDDEDTLRWGLVAGTFFGFAYGFYHVSTRPSALLEIEDGRIRLRPPDLAAAPGKGARLTLLATRF